MIFGYQHPAHPCYGASKGAAVVSSGSFSGCPKYSCPRSLVCPAQWFFWKHISDVHQLRNGSMFSHHQLIKIFLLASLWVSLSTPPLHVAFMPAVWTAMAFPSVLNFSTFILCSCTSSVWGVLFPLPFPGLKSIYARSQVPPWATATSKRLDPVIRSATPANFLHTWPLGQWVRWSYSIQCHLVWETFGTCITHSGRGTDHMSKLPRWEKREHTSPMIQKWRLRDRFHETQPCTKTSKVFCWMEEGCDHRGKAQGVSSSEEIVL